MLKVPSHDPASVALYKGPSHRIIFEIKPLTPIKIAVRPWFDESESHQSFHSACIVQHTWLRCISYIILSLILIYPNMHVCF